MLLVSSAQADRSVLVLCDYPLKEFVYSKICAENLTGFLFTTSKEIDNDYQTEPETVIVDLNIMPELEDDLKERVLNAYPTAHVIILEEDHTDLSIHKRLNGNLFITLGKRASHATLEDLLWVLSVEDQMSLPVIQEIQEDHQLRRCA